MCFYCVQRPSTCPPPLPHSTDRWGDDGPIVIRGGKGADPRDIITNRPLLDRNWGAPPAAATSTGSKHLLPSRTPLSVAHAHNLPAGATGVTLAVLPYLPAASPPFGGSHFGARSYRHHAPIQTSIIPKLLSDCRWTAHGVTVAPPSMNKPGTDDILGGKESAHVATS